MKNKTIRDIIKGVLVFAGLIVVLFIFASFDSDSNSHDNEIKNFVDNTKFPIDSYLIAEEKKETTINPLLLEQPKKEEKEESFTEQATNLKDDLEKQAKKYTNSIFEDSEEIKQKLKEQEQKRVLNFRLNGIAPAEPKQNNFIKVEEKTDYGAEKFSNIDKNKQNKATNETKLFRAITADKRIPATIIEPIDSSLSGQVTAQIEDDIYSSMGTTLLIPKGSKAIGEYVANNSNDGVNRVPIFWKRIITPYGQNINLLKSIATDIAGHSGVLGEIDNRYWKRYGLPLTLSTLSNGVLLAIAQMNNTSEDSDSQIILDNSRQDLSYIMKKIIDEQIKIRPKITILANSRIFIVSKYDIWFPKPIDGEIQAQYFNVK